MKVYSYVVARDFGFAPNPFFGVCTLATCKPRIREQAIVGDWIVGTGSAKYGLTGFLVFAMKVAEALTYNQYWCDIRFQQKKPNLRGSWKQAYGDNIYRFDQAAHKWFQANSHHSLPGGCPNVDNITHDTQTNRVLIAAEFMYWGASGPKLPRQFRSICTIRGHKCKFDEDLISSFTAWLGAFPDRGFLGQPAEFPK